MRTAAPRARSASGDCRRPTRSPVASLPSEISLGRTRCPAGEWHMRARASSQPLARIVATASLCRERSSGSGDIVARKRERTPESGVTRTWNPRGDERDSREERKHRPQPERNLRLADDRARHPCEEAEELVVVRDVRAGEDLAGTRSNEVGDRDDLVVPVAAVETVKPRPREGTSQDRVRAGEESSGHITRQRRSVRSTRRPSSVVSFLPASRVLAL